MVGVHQNLNGTRDLTMPLLGTVWHPWASTLPSTYLPTKFEVSISTHYEGYTKCQNGMVWGSYGH